MLTIYANKLVFFVLLFLSSFWKCVETVLRLNFKLHKPLFPTESLTPQAATTSKQVISKPS